MTLLAKGDVPGFAAARVLVRAALHLWYSQLGLDPRALRAQDARLLVDLADRQASMVALARDAEGTPVGVCTIFPDGDTTALRAAFVLPGHRGRGVGTRLVGVLIDAARASGVPRLVVSAAQESGLVRILSRLGLGPGQPAGPGRLRFELGPPHLPAVRTT